jgi:AraC-like DNA-binding protein
MLLPVVRVLNYCFRSFRLDAGPQTRPARHRFLSRFRFYLKLYLHKESQRRSERKAKRLSIRLLPEEGWKRLSQTEVEPVDDEYETWWAYLYRQALLRLDTRTCKYLKLRLSGLRVTDIAQRLGLSPKTTSNLYGKKRLVERMRQEVADIVLGLPAEERNAVVRFFLDEEDFTIEQVERLLCVPYERLTNGQVANCRGIEPEQVRDLLSGERRLARLA